MQTEYVYLIVGLVLLAILALVVILRYPKRKVTIKGPGVSLDIGGETGNEQSQEQTPQEKDPSAKTKIGGKVIGSTVITSARTGTAETDIGDDVEESDIRTEN